MAERTPCLRRCSTIRAASPNHEGVAGTDSEEVWMITDPSAILFMCASLMEVVLFFLLKEAHVYSCSLQISTSRCASRGLGLIGGAPLGNRHPACYCPAKRGRPSSSGWDSHLDDWRCDQRPDHTIQS